MLSPAQTVLTAAMNFLRHRIYQRGERGKMRIKAWQCSTEGLTSVSGSGRNLHIRSVLLSSCPREFQYPLIAKGLMLTSCDTMFKPNMQKKMFIASIIWANLWRPLLLSVGKEDNPQVSQYFSSRLRYIQRNVDHSFVRNTSITHCGQFQVCFVRLNESSWLTSQSLTTRLILSTR